MLAIKNLKRRAPRTRRSSKASTLTINAGEVHAIMGPNGSGKSTLAAVLAGAIGYEVTDGEVLYDGKDLLEMDPEERAREGAVPGVSVSGRNSRREQHLFSEGRAQRNPQAPRPAGTRRDGLSDQPVKEKMKLLEMDEDLLNALGQRRLFRRREKAQRNLPDGGARTEAGHPGRDRFRPGHRRAEDRRRRRQRHAQPDRAIIVITHYQRLLNYIVPDFVHVLADGRIVKSGGKELALELEEKGYGWLRGGRQLRRARQSEQSDQSATAQRP